MQLQTLPITPDRARISAFVICCNEEKNIRRCLDSIAWCDEIIVVDSGSTDKTLEICREYTDRIYSRTWPGNVEQKKYALSLCNCEWVLNIDADEEVTADLKSEIHQKLIAAQNDAADVNGYYLSRIIFHLGKWWRKGGWYPEYRMRFFRKRYAQWGGVDPHEKALVSGRTLKLKGELKHYSYSDFTAQITVLNKYSSIGAQGLLKNGRRFSLFKVLTRPLVRFFKFYFFKRGFLEGFPGFVVAVVESYDVFLKYVKLWELEKVKKEGE